MSTEQKKKVLNLSVINAVGNGFIGASVIIIQVAQTATKKFA